MRLQDDSRRPLAGSEVGFTLIETLVAMVVLMIVISSIYGSFRAANVCASRTEERADLYQTARVLLAQINSELCSAYQPFSLQESSLVGEDTEASETAPQYDRLSFLTTARRSVSSVEAAGDVCRVKYSVESTPDGEPIGLFVQEDFRPGLDMSETERPPVMLSKLVIGMNCRYLDGTTGQWLKEWIGQSGLPKAVRVELVLKPERKGAKPITVASTANLALSLGPGPEQAAEEEEVAE